MAVVSLVLDQDLGLNKAGDIIQCDEDKAAALTGQGLAHEATEEEVSGDEADTVDDTTDPATVDAAPANDAVRNLSLNAKEAVVKATEEAVTRLTKSVKRPVLPGQRHIAGSDFEATGGFKNLGDAAYHFIRKSKGDYESAKKFGRWNDHVRTKATAMTIAGGSGHQGGDLVPTQWAKDMWALSFKNVPDLMGMMSKQEMAYQSLKIPTWVQSSAATGIVAGVAPENTQLTPTVGVTATVSLDLQKFYVFANLSDELQRFNAYNLNGFLNMIFPQRIRFLMNDGVVNGTNSQVGLVNNAATITVIAEAAGHISFNDILRMDAALYDDFDGDGVWLCNKSTLPELQAMAFPNRTATTQFPAFSLGGFGDMIGPKPKGTLLGRPIYTCENVPGLGSRGALILYDPTSLAYGSTGPIADSTPYLYFDYAVDSFRVLWYADSVNPMTVAYTRADGSKASNIVVLSAGSTSSS